jgi:hypothetical protein
MAGIKPAMTSQGLRSSVFAVALAPAAPVRLFNAASNAGAWAKARNVMPHVEVMLCAFAHPTACC